MLEIRRTLPTDFLEISALDRMAWNSNSHAEFIPDGEHIWRVFSEHGIMFTALWDEQIVGTILAFACENGSYCVHKVFVHPHYQSKGIGSVLFEKLLEVFDQKGVASWLTVSPDNANALKLYEKWGYTEKTFVKGYYRKVEDRYILSRK
jgi:ribosomal protein S18 acetylase RimI-like enzyme